MYMSKCCGPFLKWEEEPHHHGPFGNLPFCSPCCCPHCYPCCESCGGFAPGMLTPLGFKRRFRTKEERIAELEAYLEALKKETQAVEEKLRCLREE